MVKIDKLTFSPEQQAGLIGHVIADSSVFQQCLTVGVKLSWFFDGRHQRIWTAIEDFNEDHKTHPSEFELLAHFKDTPEVVRDLKRYVEDALAHRSQFGLEALLEKLKEWAASQAIPGHIQKLQEHYNRGEMKIAKKIVAELGLQLDQIETITGTSNRLESSSARLTVEQPERQGQTESRGYGIGFLNDVTSGLSTNDVVVIGAKPGEGKTHLVTQMALSNSIAGTKVALFALEGENHEIERRIKYQYIVQRHRQAREGERIPFGKVNYADWRLNRLKDELGEYEAPVTEQLRTDLANLSTFYRSSGDFGIRDMERAITRASATHDVIILDHLHYVDMDSDNENTEMKAIVKKLRDLALVLGKPMIVVAHLRKSQGKYAPLLSTIEDVHGSSDIVKIATTVILIGRAQDLIVSASKEHWSRCYTTYMNLGKFRLDGSRTWYTGVTFFDPQTNQYVEGYALGELKSGRTKWVPCTTIPHWAKHIGDVKVSMADQSRR